jgi:hypothetical protein
LPPPDCGDGDQHQKIVNKADEYFQALNYVKALELYARALSIKPEDTFVKERIAACDEKLKD